MRKSLVFDFETTGLLVHDDAPLHRQPRPIEFGGLLVDEHGEILDEIGILINPEIEIDEVITKITGIQPWQLKDEPVFGACVEQIRPFFAQADCMIAHNLPFDYDILRHALARANITDWTWPGEQICTVQEHIEQFGFRPKLTVLYQHYMNEPLPQTHRALDDCMALLEVCKASGVLLK